MAHSLRFNAHIPWLLLLAGLLGLVESKRLGGLAQCQVHRVVLLLALVNVRFHTDVVVLERHLSTIDCRGILIELRASMHQRTHIFDVHTLRLLHDRGVTVLEFIFVVVKGYAAGKLNILVLLDRSESPDIGVESSWGLHLLHDLGHLL